MGNSSNIFGAYIRQIVELPGLSRKSVHVLKGQDTNGTKHKQRHWANETLLSQFGMLVVNSGRRAEAMLLCVCVGWNKLSMNANDLPIFNGPFWHVLIGEAHRTALISLIFVHIFNMCACVCVAVFSL